LKKKPKKAAHKGRARRKTDASAEPAGDTKRRAKRAPRGEATGAARTSVRESTSAKGATPRPRRIDVVLKGLTVAAEPPINANPAGLDPVFRNKLQAVLAKLASAGKPFRLVEGFRTRARQQWLFGSGRPKAVPFGRPGAILTNADGIDKLSWHQGNGTVGSGRAADCYPTREGRVFIPPSSDPVWAAYADAVEAAGLVAGFRFPSFKDSPHCELR
jgi:hypothetical protein